MRKPILLLSVAAMLGMSATARSLSPTEALGRVTNMPVSRSGGAAPMEPVLTVGSTDAPALYVFNKAEGGWMIVGADDVAAPLIAYSNTGSFDPANMPDNFKGWLELYSTEIQQASAAGAEAYSATASRAASDRTPIAPLVKTQWDQLAPFNNDCPYDTGGKTFTGCVATAMAQIMKYHNWPEAGNDKANFSYNWNNQELKADFAGVKFDWANMLDKYDNYSPDQAAAVAQLMKACGYSLGMNYSSYASAARNELVGYALAEYFNYDAGLHNELRDLHSSTEWEDMVYDNLKTYGPMVYWGGAHCFVCDGYDSNRYFHFNWGWNGFCDGYYLLSSLTPNTEGGTATGAGNGDYTMGQSALFGVKPAGDTPSKRQYTFHITEFANAYQGNLYFSLLGTFLNASPYMVDPTFIFKIYSEDGSKEITTCPVTTKRPNWGVDPSNHNTNPAGIMQGDISIVPDGTYRLYPAVIVDGVEYQFQCPPTIAGYVIVTRKNGQTTATIPTVANTIIEDLSTNGDFFLNSYFKITGVARFIGDGDTNQAVATVLYNPDGTVAGTSSAATLNFTKDGKEFELICPWFTKALNSPAIQAGDYTFALAKIENGEYKKLSSVPVTIKGRVLKPSYKKPGSIIVENADAVDPENIKITATIEGVTGVIYQDLIFTIKYNGNKVWESNAPLYVSAGQTAVVPISAAIPNATPGTRYSVVASRSNGGAYEQMTSEIYFTIGDKSGIADVEIDNNAPVEYFNLQGIRVDGDNLVPGIYIRRQGSKTTKILVK